MCIAKGGEDALHADNASGEIVSERRQEGNGGFTRLDRGAKTGIGTSTRRFYRHHCTVHCSQSKYKRGYRLAGGSDEDRSRDEERFSCSNRPWNGCWLLLLQLFSVGGFIRLPPFLELWLLF